MPITPPKLYMVRIVGEIEQQLTITTLWLKGHTASPASTVAAEISGIKSGMSATVIPAYRTCLSSKWHGNHQVILEMTTKPRVMDDIILSISGVQDAISLPAFNSQLLSLRSGFSDRSRNGRLFLPPADSGACDGSRLIGGSFGLLQAFGAALFNLWGPAGTNNYVRLGIFSPKLGRTQPLGPGTPYNYSVAGWNQCTEIIARSEISSTRKRRLGHGQ
jgi:hypothetical protein